VDFGPYLQGVFAKVRRNWYKLIPESAQMKKGELAIAFSVLKDGPGPLPMVLPLRQ